MTQYQSIYCFPYSTYSICRTTYFHRVLILRYKDASSCQVILVNDPNESMGMVSSNPFPFGNKSQAD